MNRRLFPTLRVRVAGLTKSRNYVLLVDVVPVDQFRYRYEYSTWFVAGADYTRPHNALDTATADHPRCSTQIGNCERLCIAFGTKRH